MVTNTNTKPKSKLQENFEKIAFFKELHNKSSSDLSITKNVFKSMVDTEERGLEKIKIHVMNLLKDQIKLMPKNKNCIEFLKQKVSADYDIPGFKLGTMEDLICLNAAEVFINKQKCFKVNVSFNKFPITAQLIKTVNNRLSYLGEAIGCRLGFHKLGSTDNTFYYAFTFESGLKDE